MGTAHPTTQTRSWRLGRTMPQNWLGELGLWPLRRIRYRVINTLFLSAPFGIRIINSLLNRGAALLVAIAITAIQLGTYTPVQAQQASPPIFENVTISPKFSPDPLTVRGISGGSVPGKDVADRAETANGPCVGFVDEKPDHTLVVTDFFKYLSLQVQSPKDTTIIVRGPGGSWCNDDSKGKNPGISGQWLAGTYSVWVGSYDQTKYHPYILQITESR